MATAARASTLLAPWACLLVLFAALVTLGCAASRVAGAEDVELTYEADPAALARHGGDLRALVLRRLGAAQLGADVTGDGPQVRIIVDERLASTVDELVTWSGTLALFATAPSVSFTPRDGAGLEPVSDVLPDGTVDHYFEGSRGDVLSAAETVAIDGDHLVLAEPLTLPRDARTPARWRTRVVRARPSAELDEGFFVGWGEGAELRFRAAVGSEAAFVLAHARRRALEPRAPREVVSRGRTSLGLPRVDDSALVLSFGDGPPAYARAQHERRLLGSAHLPPLRRVGAVGLPPNTALGAACVVVPVLLSLGWLAFVRRFDRAHPEPMWLVGVTFAAGALATLPASLVEVAWTKVSPWLDPSLASLGGRLEALPLSFAVFTLVVGLSEEGAKLLGTLFAAQRREFDEPVDGIVYGVVSSLGFAAAENIRYFAQSRMNAPAVIARCFMSVPAHMFFGALWGYALGAQLIERRRGRVALAVLAAAAAHGLFDALLAADGAAGFALLLNLLLASAFVTVIRRSLRHGVVSEASRSVPAEARRRFRVGRPTLFVASAIAVHALAFGIFVLGVWYQYARHRPSSLFVGGSTAMVALLALAAFGVASALPLDVVVDAYGVTFAGAARAWSRIRSFRVEADHVELDCEAGPIVLGPGEPRVVEALARELQDHIGSGAAERVATLDVTGPRSG